MSEFFGLTLQQLQDMAQAFEEKAVFVEEQCQQDNEESEETGLGEFNPDCNHIASDLRERARKARREMWLRIRSN